MLTLSIVIEDRDDHGDLREYHKHEVTSPDVALLACSHLSNADRAMADAASRMRELWLGKTADTQLAGTPEAERALLATGKQIEKRYVYILGGVVLDYPNTEPVEVAVHFMGPGEEMRIIPMAERSARELAEFILRELSKDRPGLCIDVTIGPQGKLLAMSMGG
jgi:hypothetical protein